MATTTDRYQKIAGTGEIDGVNYIGYSSAAGDQRRASVDHPVMNLADKVIAIIARLDKLTPQALFEFFDLCLW
jgi:hypothetical protein